MPFRIPTALLAFAVAAFGAAGAARAQFDQLVMKVPRFANAMVVIDVNAVIKAPLAVKEKWAGKLEAASAGRAMVLPPEASRIVIASRLATQGQLEANWEMAVMDLNEPISLKAIARAEGGYVDSINGLNSVWTPSNAYFVSFGDRTLGMMSPGDRQYVSHWAEFARDNHDMVVSEYLHQATYAVGPAGQIVLAMDLKDMVQPHRLDAVLDNSPALAKKKDDLTAIAATILGLRGVMLSVNVGETANGVLRVDFTESVGPLKSVAKPLFLEALNQWGASIDDFKNWDVTVGDTYIKLEGDLSTNGLRRVFSILEIPTTKFSTLADQADNQSESTSESLIAQSSLAYFNSVGTLIDDLQKDLHDNRDNHAVWMERYAKKIDRLPILNVDDQLLAWGSSVAESFRNMGLAKRGAAISAGVRKAGVYTNYYYSGTNYAYPGSTYSGYRSTRTSTRVKNEIDRQEQAQAQEVRFSGFKEIADQRAQLRITMTKKYNIEF